MIPLSIPALKGRSMIGCRIAPFQGLRGIERIAATSNVTERTLQREWPRVKAILMLVI
jgi:hypothetical protein